MTPIAHMKNKKKSWNEGDLISRSLDLSPKHYLQTIMSLLRKVPSNIQVIYQSVPLHCWFFSAFWFQIIHFLPILAHFRQLPPTFTYIPSILYIFPTFFYKINFWCHQVPCSKIWFLAHIFGTNKAILKIVTVAQYILSQISPNNIVLLVIQPNLQIFFSLWVKFGVWAKFPR